jgi:hypothetical protein
MGYFQRGRNMRWGIIRGSTWAKEGGQNNSGKRSSGRFWFVFKIFRMGRRDKGYKRNSPQASLGFSKAWGEIFVDSQDGILS